MTAVRTNTALQCQDCGGTGMQFMAAYNGAKGGVQMIAAKTPTKTFKQAPDKWTPEQVKENIDWLNDFSERWTKKRDERLGRVDSTKDKRGGK